MSDIFIGDTNITQLLEDKLPRLENGWVTLLHIPVKNALDINITALRVLQEQGYEGIYITLSKPYPELKEIFESKGLDVGKLLFIDGVSQMYGTPHEDESESVRYVEGPLSIEEIKEEIKGVASGDKDEKRFVILDSITTVMLYNSTEETVEFTEFITESLHKMGWIGIVVSVSRGMGKPELFAELSEIANEIIEIPGPQR